MFGSLYSYLAGLCRGKWIAAAVASDARVYDVEAQHTAEFGVSILQPWYNMLMRLNPHAGVMSVSLLWHYDGKHLCV
jgi:creatinine amidohydrolase/Fe(II)-dependent formamide hydrolase-like protein